MNLHKIIGNLGLIVIPFLITGCVTWKDGVRLPDKEDVVKRSQYKVFVDESATIKAENEFLQLSKELMAKGFASTNYYRITNNTYLSKLDFDANGFACIYYPDDNNAEYCVNGINFDVLKKFTDFEYLRNNNTTVKFEDFIIQDRSLISTKQYKNKTEIMRDYFYIKNGLEFVLGYQLGELTGFQYYILDGKALKENKLVLIPLTKVFSLKEVFDRTLKAYGYQVVQDKNSADKIFETEVITFAKYKNIKDSKKQSIILTPKIDGNFNNTTMQLANSLGASSDASAGVGLALIGLNLLGTSTNEKIMFSTVAKYYDKNDENSVENISILQPVTKDFARIEFVQNRYIVADKPHNDIGKTVESYIDFMDGGSMRNKYDKIIKKSNKHKIGVVQ